MLKAPVINFFEYKKDCMYMYFVHLPVLVDPSKIVRNGLFSGTILDCSVALNDVEDNIMMDSVKVGLKYGEPCYTLSDGCNTT